MPNASPSIKSVWSRRRFLQTAAATSAFATALTACGSRKVDTVRLGWSPGSLSMMAKERGDFEKWLGKDNIKVEWVGPFPNHAPSLQAVTGGSADFSFGGSTTPALAAMIAGSPLVFASFNAIEPRSTAIIARDGSGIARVEDLVGKSVAVNRSGLGELLLVAALEKHRIDRNLVKFVYLNPPDAAPAFSQGKVDAWAMWSPTVDIARENYKAHDIFVDGRDLDLQIDFLSYVTTRKFSTDNPDLVRAVNAAFSQEAKWVSENPADAERLSQEKGHYSDSVRDSLTAMKRQYVVYGAGDLGFIRKLQVAADWLAAHQVLPEKIAVADYLAKA
ncbi:sulfonate ABC transporter substrate-binding protein [Paraburkholderia phytofirmans OLGA172]|uniref:Sulfonate ABC transporter substrate-binding protein n=2 Tax=Paraburkholderia phytofirmans TaxID=261302 RepID=A0A160FQG6_9BURK|nr:sulfonate ABC transporter substrate-binding protein [Paraburkholderia phytofirmans OLGA172]